MARAGRSHFAAWSVAALATGLALGLLLHRSDAAWIAPVADALRTVGRIWISALQLTVVPLVVGQVIVAMLSAQRLGSLGVRTLLVFSAMLLATAAFALLVTPPLLALYSVDRDTVASLMAGVAAPSSGAAAPAEATPLLAWLKRFFMGQYLLYVLLGSVAFALLLRRFTGSGRRAVQTAIEWLARATERLVGALLLAAPLGILALSFGLARSAGGSSFGLLIAFVLITCGVALALSLLLYPATALLGGIPIRRFARAAAPAQVVGLSTRSSLAALPALVEAAHELRLPPAAAGFVLPFAMATVKISRAMSAPIILMFLAHALGLPLGPERLLPFVGSVLLLSWVVPGLPGRGPEAATLPLYLAAGIPLEGVMILEAVDAIPDMFKTGLNVTSMLSGAAIVTRPAAMSGNP
jgi:Na+/H+-dicarboxylate symporter